MSSRSKTRTQTTTSLTPWAEQQYGTLSQGILDIANRPVEPYGGLLSAGPDPLQTQAQGLAQANLGLGRDAVSAAIEAAQAAGGHAPVNVQAGSLYGMDLSGYLDPMLDTTAEGLLGGLDHSRRLAINDQAGDFTRQGAWGGSRHGVADAITNETYAGLAASGLSDLYSRALAAAQDHAQTDLDRQLRASMANQAAWADQGALGLSAAELLGTLGQQQQEMGAAEAELLNQFGTQNQAINQQALDAAYQEWLRQQSVPFANAELMQGVLNATPMPTTVRGKTTTSSFNPLDWIRTALNAASTFGAGGGSGGGS